ncbi:lytic transglycosylase domain-containing protein [Aquamicrobium terrae]|uniref:Transglycosylase SLT domain-containing protein n=1 Tax=Aquamicrobium terrae TaxID=1324945 RepID=A0ABV2MZL1_9HYPH
MAVQRPAGVERSCAVRRPALFLLLSGLLLGLAPAPASRAETVQAAQPAAGAPYAVDIAEAAHRFGIPAGWIAAVLAAESNGDPTAVSSAGAMGLMQLMPATWDEQRALHLLGSDPFQPRDNILAGAAYLRAMWDRYRTVTDMLGAYNFGPGRYDEYLAGKRGLPLETRDYIAALAPVLAGEPLALGALAGPPRVTDWRDAPLFVTAPTSTGTAPGLHGERSAGAPSDAPAASPGSLAPAPAEALFVVRSGSGDAP